MKMPIIVLYAGAYQFTDEQTGEIKEGVGCSYYLNTELSSSCLVDGKAGIRPSKASFALSDIEKFVKAPALYDGEFEMTVDSKGKVTLKLVDLSYVSDVVIRPLAPSEPEKEDPAKEEKKAPAKSS